MNFKEIYKAANEEISGDRSLIDAVIKKADKKPVFKMAYPLACAAAALMIVVGISVYPKNSVKQVPNYNVASNKGNDLNNKTDISIGTDKKENTKIYDKTEDAVENKQAVKNDAITESETLYKEPAVQNDVTVDTSSHEQTEQSADLSHIIDVPMIAMLDINDIEPSLPSAATFARSGSGGASAESESIEYEGMTAEQYYEYIGTDITQKIELPEGMEFEEFFGATVKRDIAIDSVISDNAEFYASGEQKFVSLTVSKLSGIVQDKLDDETLKKSDIIGNPAVLEGYENTCRIYIKYAEVYYNIYSEGLTAEEIENLLISICKN